MSCSTCKGKCAAPEACHQPEPLPRTYRPDYTVSGPFSRPRRRQTLRLMALASLIGAFLLAAHFFTTR